MLWGRLSGAGSERLFRVKSSMQQRTEASLMMTWSERSGGAKVYLPTGPQPQAHSQDKKEMGLGPH